MAAREYASINLAQSVILCAYELRMALAKEQISPAEPLQLGSAAASMPRWSA